MRVVRLGGAMCVAALLIMPGAVGLAEERKPPGASAVGEPESQLVSEARRLEVATRQYADLFIGTAVDVDRGSLKLYVTNPDDARFTAAVTRARQQFAVDIVQGAHPIAELDALTNRLAELFPKLQESGYKITKFGPSLETGQLVVNLENGTDDQRQELRSLLDKDILFTSESGAGSIAFGRSDDTPPFYGGAYQEDTSNSFGSCTSGFSVKGLSSGASFNTFAGHCTRWHTYDHHYAYIGSEGEFGQPLGSHRTVGEVTASGYLDFEVPRDHLDVALVNMYPGNSNTNVIFGNGSATNYVTAVAHPVVGSTVCISGGLSGVRCGGVQGADYNSCVADSQYPNVVNCHLVWVQTGSVLAGQGDSGSPVYTSATTPAPNGANVTAVGILQGGHNNSSAACPTYANNGRICSSGVWISDAAWVQTVFGVAFKTNSSM